MDVTYHLRFDWAGDGWDLRSHREWAIYAYCDSPPEPVFRLLPAGLECIEPKGPNIWT